MEERESQRKRERETGTRVAGFLENINKNSIRK